MQNIVAPDNEDVEKIIKKLDLIKHVEGGYYKRVYEASDTFFSQRHNGNRCTGTSIYYLFTNTSFSAWHKLKSDEIWHYYYGSSVIVHSIDPNGEIHHAYLGNSIVNEKMDFQVIIPQGYWFAAELNEPTPFSLVGCTVSPGFKYQDFELGCFEKLIKQYPQYLDIITRLSHSGNS